MLFLKENDEVVTWSSESIIDTVIFSSLQSKSVFLFYAYI